MILSNRALDRTLAISVAAVIATTIYAAFDIVSRNHVAADNVAIGKAMACLIAKHPVPYTTEVAGRRIGQRIARQLLADLEARGASPDVARLSLTLSVCVGMPDQEPLPLVPED